ncbi:MAG: hypothetical protein JXB30_09565 [Anaerolineae bacterium]|nr:hypothetical protein [Anaerolineae bacterium]
MEQNSVVQERPEGDEKRRNTWLIVGIVVVVVLCLCIVGGGIIGGAYFLLGPSMSVSQPAVVTVFAMTVPVPAQSALPTDTPVSPNRDDGDDVDSGDSPAGGDADGLLEQLDAGELTLDGVDVSESATIGPVLSVEVTNPGSEDVTVIIPCGLIFEPQDSGEQRMMVIQQTSAVVPAGGSASIEAVVACIDSIQSTPSGVTGYTVGTSAGGELLTLANCLCQRDLNIESDMFGGMGTQLAVWAVVDGTSPSAMLDDFEQAEGAMGDLLEGLEALEGLEGMEGMDELLEQLQDLDQFLGPAVDEAEAILSECGISVQ